MEKIALRVFDRPMIWRDVELPRQIRRRAECLLVEEIPPSPDGLADREARGGDIEVGQHRKAAPPRVAAAQEHAADHTTVNGETAFPDGEDLGGYLTVVVEVERDV